MLCVIFHAPWSSPIWDFRWVSVFAIAVSADDVNARSYSVSMLVKWVTFQGTLHWPVAGAYLGVGSFLSNCFSCMSFWAGERLVLEKALPVNRKSGRPNSVSAVPLCIVFGDLVVSLGVL